jgi:uncharacterized membrane-anchored protein YjiN (DUF445 family)
MCGESLEDNRIKHIYIKYMSANNIGEVLTEAENKTSIARKFYKVWNCIANLSISDLTGAVLRHFMTAMQPS